MSRRSALRSIIGGVLLVVLLVLAAPAPAHADDIFPIVRCGLANQPPCAPCDIWATFKRLIDLLLTGITIPIGAFMIVYAGVMILLAAGNPSKLQAAKTLLTNTFIGIGIILGAWLFTNFLIRSLAADNVATEWYKFSCPNQLATITNIDPKLPADGAVFPSVPPGTPASCNKTLLAAAYDTSPVVKNSSELDVLISCLMRDPIVAAATDQRKLFTYEVGADLLPGKPQEMMCNFSRGRNVCSQKCKHGLFSCHYGGRTGGDGSAKAVDFNWNYQRIAYNYKERTIYPDGKCPTDPTPAPSGEPSPTPTYCRIVTGEHGLFDELYRAAVKNRCQYKFLFFEGKDPDSLHTHISTVSCSSDGVGLQGRSTPSPLP